MSLTSVGWPCECPLKGRRISIRGADLSQFSVSDVMWGEKTLSLEYWGRFLSLRPSTLSKGKTIRIGISDITLPQLLTSTGLLLDFFAVVILTLLQHRLRHHPADGFRNDVGSSSPGTSILAWKFNDWAGHLRNYKQHRYLAFLPPISMSREQRFRHIMWSVLAVGFLLQLIGSVI